MTEDKTAEQERVVGFLPTLKHWEQVGFRAGSSVALDLR